MLLDSAADVIDALGGVHATAELTDTNYKAAHAWKQRGRFPTKTYLVITEALRLRGLQARADLWKMVRAK
jgi:hypothetical protein